MVVNITANDDYNGRFMFSTLSVSVEEAGDVVMNDNSMIILSLSFSVSLSFFPPSLSSLPPSSLHIFIDYFYSIVAELIVIREGGTFGTVTVPYMIESSAVDDLSPSNGLLIFNEGITQMVRFQLFQM